MEVYFVVVQPIGKPKKFKLQDGEYVIIGRDRNVCQVPLADDMCSIKHAKVSYSNHCVYVEDLGSKNGIYLNGVKIVKQRVYKDDKIKLGDSVMYINTDKLSEEELTYLTYSGQSSRRNQGFTLELVNKSKSGGSKGVSENSLTGGKGANIVMSRRKAAELRYKKERKKSYVKSLDNEDRISKEKMKVLETIAWGIDAMVTGVAFFVFIYIFRMVKADVYYKLSQEYTGLDLYLADDMAFYTFLSLVGAAFVYTRNRSMVSGSIGEKILKIN